MCFIVNAEERVHTANQKYGFGIKSDKVRKVFFLYSLLFCLSPQFFQGVAWLVWPLNPPPSPCRKKAHNENGHVAAITLLHGRRAAKTNKKKMCKSFLCLDGTLRLFSEKFLVLGICFVSVLFLVTRN